MATAELEAGVPQAARRMAGAGQLLLFLLGRLGQMLVTLALLLPAIFLLFRLVPGDPADAVVGPDVDPSVAEHLREVYGLDRPLLQQYGRWLWQLAQGDLGTSFQYKIPVLELLGDRLLNTVVLVVPAVILAVIIGCLLGAIAATRGGAIDRVLRTTAYAVKASPSFWVATMALFVLSFQLGWVPSIGMRSQSGSADEASVTRFASMDFLHHLILPMTILTVYYVIEPMLTMRTSMKEILHQEFIELGTAKGLSRRRIMLRHGARNGLLPVVSLAPVIVENVIGGQVITETVFSWPGMGRAIVEAVENFDYPVMQAAFLLMAIAVVLVNAGVDVVYAYLDPRVRVR